MAEVVSIQARSVRVPLDVTTAFARRSVDARWYTIVRARDVDGVVGIGFCYAGSEAGTLSTVAVRELIAPYVVGRDSHETVGIWEEVYQHTLLHGRAGSVMRALSAVDIALWDLNARAAGLSLSKLLGSNGQSKVSAYASGGYYRDGKGPDDLAREVQGYVDSGFDAAKIKVGGASIGLDTDRIAAVRSVLGPERLLMLDANNAWRDYPTAARAISAWERYDPYWIEEPFLPDDVENHARLSASTPILVVTGEVEAGRWRAIELLRRSASAYLQVDAAVCGGVTEFMRIAHTADSFGVAMAPHWFHDLHVHLVAALSNGAWVEFFPGEDVFNFRKLIHPQLHVGGEGELLVPQTPGLGFDLVEESVERYGVEAWA